MKRYIILILMFTAACLNFGALADDRNGYTIKIESNNRLIYSKNDVKPSEQIPLREALNQILNAGNPKLELYGDFVDNQLLGGAGGLFTKKWTTRGRVITISRENEKSPIVLNVPDSINGEWSEELKATIRRSITRSDGQVDPNCAGNEISFVVTITSQEKSAESTFDEDEEDGTKIHEGECCDVPTQDSTIESGINIMSSLPILSLILSLINLGLIIILFKKSSKELDKSVSVRDHSKEIKGLKNDIQNLTNLLSQKHLTEDDVKRIVMSMTPTKPVVVPSPELGRRTPTTPTPSPVQTTESIDTLEYSFQENKFIVTRESQPIFVIHRNGNKYTFTLKDAGICQEIMPMLNAYKCISVMGNTSSANGIGSITPGELYPTGDGRSFSIATPIVINFI